jgi:hypothetical protein
VITAHSVADPDVKLAQLYTELPVATWYTSVLLKVGEAADWDAVKVA